jgi:hypothetical protein
VVRVDLEVVGHGGQLGDSYGSKRPSSRPRARKVVSMPNSASPRGRSLVRNRLVHHRAGIAGRDDHDLVARLVGELGEHLVAHHERVVGQQTDGVLVAAVIAAAADSCDERGRDAIR